MIRAIILFEGCLVSPKSHGMEVRIKFIDQLLAFHGQATRADLVRFFGVGTATASRAFSEYRRRYPGNIAYEIADRNYRAASTFIPAFEHDVHSALLLLAYGKDVRNVGAPLWSPPEIEQLTAPLSPESIAPLTRALVAGLASEIEYASASSGVASRQVQPHAIFVAGGAWYLRAYDSIRADFRSFRLSRVISAQAASVGFPEGVADMDASWNTAITLTLAPHPYHPNPESLRRDLGLTDKPVKNVSVPQALAGFTLIDLRVDSSTSGCLDPQQYPLRLMNRHELDDVASLKISPGWSS